MSDQRAVFYYIVTGFSYQQINCIASLMKRPDEWGRNDDITHFAFISNKQYGFYGVRIKRGFCQFIPEKFCNSDSCIEFHLFEIVIFSSIPFTYFLNGPCDTVILISLFILSFLLPEKITPLKNHKLIVVYLYKPYVNPLLYNIINVHTPHKNSYFHLSTTIHLTLMIGFFAKNIDTFLILLTLAHHA